MTKRPEAVETLMNELIICEIENNEYAHVPLKDVDIVYRHILELEQATPSYEAGFRAGLEAAIGLMRKAAREHEIAGSEEAYFRITYLADDIGALPVPSSPSGSQGWLDIYAERQRQVKEEGWTPEHDDEHVSGEMAAAAAVYALEGITTDRWAKILWPWSVSWFKPKDRRRNLVRAGALIVAELERVDRAAAPQVKGVGDGNPS